MVIRGLLVTCTNGGSLAGVFVSVFVRFVDFNSKGETDQGQRKKNENLAEPFVHRVKQMISTPSLPQKKCVCGGVFVCVCIWEAGFVTEQRVRK